MFTKNDILIKPLITEKSMRDAQAGVFTFLVSKKASKNQIKRAIEKIFNVNVVSLRTSIKKGKVKLAGRLRKKTKTSDTKKVFIGLKTGQKIDLFEVGK